MSNSPIWPIIRSLSDATTPGQSRPGIDGNEGVFGISQSTIRLFNVIGHSLGGEGSYTSAEIQLVYSTALANWACLKGARVYCPTLKVSPPRDTDRKLTVFVPERPRAFFLGVLAIQQLCIMSYQRRLLCEVKWSLCVRFKHVPKNISASFREHAVCGI